MQVISRCRENYQQKQWDEGAALYIMFRVQEWTEVHNLGKSASAQKDDSICTIRENFRENLPFAKTICENPL